MTTCSFCAHENLTTAKFCNECGSPLDLLPCPQCTAVNARASTVCHRCGADVDGVAGPASTPAQTEAGSERVLAHADALIASLQQHRFALGHDQAVRINTYEDEPRPFATGPLLEQEIARRSMVQDDVPSSQIPAPAPSMVVDPDERMQRSADTDEGPPRIRRRASTFAIVVLALIVSSLTAGFLIAQNPEAARSWLARLASPVPGPAALPTDIEKAPAVEDAVRVEPAHAESQASGGATTQAVEPSADDGASTAPNDAALAPASAPPSPLQAEPVSSQASVASPKQAERSRADRREPRARRGTNDARSTDARNNDARNNDARNRSRNNTRNNTRARVSEVAPSSLPSATLAPPLPQAPAPATGAVDRVRNDPCPEGVAALGLCAGRTPDSPS
ncbi:MAG TPA: zinc ribbon domain-containing protein [Casimicrobiaceae bacterium]|nr:zinc ribbon domain-containing protein [Casimicrobiaceae bacterium]